jgi:hypothetical protein
MQDGRIDAAMKRVQRILFDQERKEEYDRTHFKCRFCGEFLDIADWYSHAKYNHIGQLRERKGQLREEMGRR